MTKRADLYKEGTVFFYDPPGGAAVEMEVAVDGGPLCVGRVFDHRSRQLVTGLYWIYHKVAGAHFGPFFASIPLADRAMRKILKHFTPAFFKQNVEWLRHQTHFKTWVEKNIGDHSDLIGGVWDDDTSER